MIIVEVNAQIGFKVNLDSGEASGYWEIRLFTSTLIFQ